VLLENTLNNAQLWTLPRSIVKAVEMFLFLHSIVHAYDTLSARSHQRDPFRVACFPTLIVRAIASSKLACSTRTLLEKMENRVESSPREISLAGLSSRCDLEREPRTPVIVIARLGPSLACSRSSSGRTNRVDGCRRKLAGIEKQRKREGKREGRANEKEEKEEVEGESLTPAAKRRTPLAIHQSRLRRFFRRNNHRTDSYRSLRAWYSPPCLSAFPPLARAVRVYAIVMRCGLKLLSLEPFITAQGIIWGIKISLDEISLRERRALRLGW